MGKIWELVEILEEIPNRCSLSEFRIQFKFRDGTFIRTFSFAGGLRMFNDFYDQVLLFRKVSAEKKDRDSSQKASDESKPASEMVETLEQDLGLASVQKVDSMDCDESGQTKSNEDYCGKQTVQKVRKPTGTRFRNGNVTCRGSSTTEHDIRRVTRNMAKRMIEKKDKKIPLMVSIRITRSALKKLTSSQEY